MAQLECRGRAALWVRDAPRWLLVWVIFVAVVVCTAHGKCRSSIRLWHPLTAEMPVMLVSEDVAVLRVGVNINPATLIHQRGPLCISDWVVKLSWPDWKFLPGHERWVTYNSHIAGSDLVRWLAWKRSADVFDADSVLSLTTGSLPVVLDRHREAENRSDLNSAGAANLIEGWAVSEADPCSEGICHLFLAGFKLPIINTGAKYSDPSKYGVNYQQPFFERCCCLGIVVIGFLFGIFGHFCLFWSGYSYWSLRRRIFLGLASWMIAAVAIWQGATLLVNL